MGKKEERWDIYDSSKKKTGRTMRRNDWNMEPGDYHLTVLGVVCRPDGRYLITKRSETKSYAPGHWEVSGGGVKAGEESFDAVCREVEEETGLDVRNADGGYVFSYRRDNPEEKDNYFVDIYRFILDFDEKDLKPDGEETAGFMLADKSQIEEIASKGMFLHYNSIRQVFI